jgi:hypothetical protein
VRARASRWVISDAVRRSERGRSSSSQGTELGRIVVVIIVIVVQRPVGYNVLSVAVAPYVTRRLLWPKSSPRRQDPARDC